MNQQNPMTNRADMELMSGQEMAGLLVEFLQNDAGAANEFLDELVANPPSSNRHLLFETVFALIQRWAQAVSMSDTESHIQACRRICAIMGW